MYNVRCAVLVLSDGGMLLRFLGMSHFSFFRFSHRFHDNYYVLYRALILLKLSVQFRHVESRSKTTSTGEEKSNKEKARISAAVAL